MKRKSNDANILPAPGQNRRNKKPPKFVANEDRIDRHLDPDGDVATHDASLLEMAGTKDPDLMCYLVGQAADAIQRTEKPQADILNKAVAALAGIGPRDELESMLAVQMIAVHHLAMECMKRARRSQPIEGMNYHINCATKLQRTFVAQVEALNRYRGKGQQKVTVEHVHINKGGQAIVGAVNQEGGGGNGNL